MLDKPEDPRRIDVWVAMAGHFLDTETRHDIPLTAMRCVEANLSTVEARDVWCYEVSPAVAFNAWDIAGEWAAWDREWLLGRIRRVRSRWSNRTNPLRWFLYRARVHFTHRVWLAIERCMDALLEVRSLEERDLMSTDLAYLGRHYFDFCPDDPANMDDATRKRLLALYPEPFRQIMAPALVTGEAALADRRVRVALDWKETP